MARKKPDISEWTIEIRYTDYKTGKEIDINQFSPSERQQREKEILDSAFKKIGYLPYNGQSST